MHQWKCQELQNKKSPRSAELLHMKLYIILVKKTLTLLLKVRAGGQHRVDWGERHRGKQFFTQAKMLVLNYF